MSIGDFTKLQNMSITSLLIAFLIVITFTETLAQNSCIFSLDRNEQAFHITPKIILINYAKVHPAQLLANTGIILPCHYIDKDGIEKTPQIRSYEFAFVRNHSVYRSGVIKSPFFEKNIQNIISDVHVNDSLIIFNMDISVNSDGEEVHVANNYKNIIVDSIKIRFVYALKKISAEELRMNQILSKNNTFEKLTDYYGSDLSLDGNLIMKDFKYNSQKKLLSKRYLFSIGDKLNYDFTFKVDRANKIICVIDNIRKKQLTLKQWEKMMFEFR